MPPICKIENNGRVDRADKKCTLQAEMDLMLKEVLRRLNATRNCSVSSGQYKKVRIQACIDQLVEVVKKSQLNNHNERQKSVHLGLNGYDPNLSKNQLTFSDGNDGQEVDFSEDEQIKDYIDVYMMQVDTPSINLKSIRQDQIKKKKKNDVDSRETLKNKSTSIRDSQYVGNPVPRTSTSTTINDDVQAPKGNNEGDKQDYATLGVGGFSSALDVLSDDTNLSKNQSTISDINDGQEVDFSDDEQRKDDASRYSLNQRKKQSSGSNLKKKNANGNPVPRTSASTAISKDSNTNSKEKTPSKKIAAFDKSGIPTLAQINRILTQAQINSLSDRDLIKKYFESLGENDGAAIARNILRLIITDNVGVLYKLLFILAAAMKCTVKNKVKDIRTAVGNWLKSMLMQTILTNQIREKVNEGTKTTRFEEKTNELFDIGILTKEKFPLRSKAQFDVFNNHLKTDKEFRMRFKKYFESLGENDGAAIARNILRLIITDNVGVLYKLLFILAAAMKCTVKNKVKDIRTAVGNWLKSSKGRIDARLKSEAKKREQEKNENLQNKGKNERKSRKRNKFDPILSEDDSYDEEDS
ncbi:hypothetical protein TSAR_007212 [Trichomalopsis sarcophagae]|uniref:DUF4806 domain-containing protein n=1 Tax=Trichomalopsis sarcophagae TaxID=543379 RepID=A0A232FMH5_9HYME|nr:hypothetical protein TSAR_007212 [Trichomalopsis sarcophagae]